MFGYRAYGLTLASEIELPELRPRGIAGAGCEIRLADPPAGEPEWFHAWRLAGRRPWLSFARIDAGYLLRFSDLADFGVSSAGDAICCRPRPGLSRATLRHLLLDQVLPLAMSRSHPVVLHASAVHLPGIGAVALAGPAGAGKSTLAAALAAHGGSVLTDDCLVVDETADGPAVRPGYPGLRLWRDAAAALGHSRRSGRPVAHYSDKRRLPLPAGAFRARPSVLAAVVVLAPRRRTGALARAVPLGPRERLVALTRYLFMLDIADRRQLTRTFTAAAALVARVPVLALALRDDPRQLHATAGAVRELVRERVHSPASNPNPNPNPLNPLNPLNL